MLTFRTGAAGSAGGARLMAEHLTEQTLSPAQMALAAYYQQGLAAPGLRAALKHGEAIGWQAGASGHDNILVDGVDLPGLDIPARVAGLPEAALEEFAGTQAQPRQDMHPRLALLLGLDLERPLTVEQIAGILSGNRTDGWPIDGKQVQRASESLATVLGLDPGAVPSAEAVEAILAGQRADGTELSIPQAQAASIRQRFLSLYGLRGEQGVDVPPEARAHIAAGRKADGRALASSALTEGLTASRVPIGYVDLCWSTDKTVALAWAFAPTEAERNIIAQAHRDAVDRAMRHVETEIGRARRGKAGRAGYEPGAIAWVGFEHYTSRPTVEIVRADPTTGGPRTEIVSLKVAGDPQLHTHVAVPNLVLTESGRVGALDLQRLEGRIHEWGALYQAHLATNLRRAGIEVTLDPERGSARIVAIPERIRAAFSKRTERGVDAARRYATGVGLDWGMLSPEQRIGLAKRGVQGDPRQVKQDDLSDWASWRRQAEALGWRHASVIRPQHAPVQAETPRATAAQGPQADSMRSASSAQRAASVSASPPGSRSKPVPVSASGNAPASRPSGPSPTDRFVAGGSQPANQTSDHDRDYVGDPADGDTDRIAIAYEAALGLLERDLDRRAVLDESVARVAAARGLIASGIEDAHDIDAVMATFLTQGVRQNGAMVGLIRGEADPASRRPARLTTTLHASREAELIGLAKAAGADRRGALDRAMVDAAIQRSPADFTTTHGRAQRALIQKLGTGERLGVAIGVAGAGKSTLLAPLVDAWKLAGYHVHGAALAWRQSDELAAAGIAEADRAALSVFLDRAQRGEIKLGARSVVVVDELGLIGTRQLLDLLRLQAVSGCRIVALGDEKQCQSIEAGPVIDLLRRALGPEAVPELLSSVRQETVRERETALLFRDGQAAAALARLRAEDRAVMVPGGHQEAAEAVADLWQRLRAAHADEASYSLTVSAPSNADARAIAIAIRARRREAGEIGPDQAIVPACDQTGDAYDLSLAPGDRVRLFSRTNARYVDRGRGVIGNNGSVLEVVGVNATGLTLRNAQGREGLVVWDTLRDPQSRRIRLAYGDVLTIDAAQGITSTVHILALPSGSRTATGFKAYTAASRHRTESHMVFSAGAERREVMSQRPLGDPRPVADADLWANAARNLSRQPEQESATAFLERAHQAQRAAARALQAGLRPAEQRAAEGQVPTTLATTWQRHRTVAGLNETIAATSEAVAAQTEALGGLAQAIRKAVDAALRTAWPVIKRIVTAFTLRPEQVAQRAELGRLREEWVRRQLVAWRKEDDRAHPLHDRRPATIAAAARDQEARQVIAEAQFRQQAAAVPAAELRQIAVQWQEAEKKAAAEAAHRIRVNTGVSM